MNKSHKLPEVNEHNREGEWAFVLRKCFLCVKLKAASGHVLGVVREIKLFLTFGMYKINVNTFIIIPAFNKRFLHIKSIEKRNLR